jgi:hypothetical protein
MGKTREVLLLLITEKLGQSKRNKDPEYPRMIHGAINRLSPQELMLNPVIMEMAQEERAMRWPW